MKLRVDDLEAHRARRPFDDPHRVVNVVRDEVRHLGLGDLTDLVTRDRPDLLDMRNSRPLLDLRISLLDRCNFRCPYCMPETEFHADYEFLNRSQRLTHEEILKIVRVATGLGVSKIRLTGGEPLLDKKLPQLVSGIAALPGVEDLALTTNAMLLAPVAQRLRDAGLHGATISLDSIDPVIFKAMSGGRGDLDKVMQGIAAAEQAGLDPIKINVVVQRGVHGNTARQMEVLGKGFQN